jgi:hypothetical protein
VGSEKVWSGSCLCGGVRYEIDGELGAILNCHCSMCRKAHGAAFRTRVSVPRQCLRIVQGRELLAEYRSSFSTVRRFCRVCGSPMMNSWTEEPDAYGLALATLDQDPGRGPLFHVFAGSKAPWYVICDGLPQFEGDPPAPVVPGEQSLVGREED